MLKDAAATAIYGSRGSNGVVVITTKRGLPRADQRHLQQLHRQPVGLASAAACSPAQSIRSSSRRAPSTTASTLDRLRHPGPGQRTQRGLAERGASDRPGEQRRAGGERRRRAAALPAGRHLVRPGRHRHPLGLSAARADGSTSTSTPNSRLSLSTSLALRGAHRPAGERRQRKGIITNAFGESPLDPGPARQWRVRRPR